MSNFEIEMQLVNESWPKIEEQSNDEIEDTDVLINLDIVKPAPFKCDFNFKKTIKIEDQKIEFDLNCGNTFLNENILKNHHKHCFLRKD